jgi:hypothetical protein
MSSDGTIGGLVGSLDVLRIECPTCARQGRYHVARLLKKLGADARLIDWLHERTADSPKKNPAGPHTSMRCPCAGLGRSAVMKEIVLVTLAIDTETGS